MNQLAWKSLLFAAIMGMAAACGNDAPEKEIVFMDNFKVFEQFEMKKDYDQLLQQEMGGEQQRLDSMTTALNSLADPLQIDRQKKQLYEAQQQLEERFGAQSDQYTKEVYTRLNTYIKAYGKQHGYRMILGATGQGSVMYVDTTADITTDLIRYINTEYAK